MKDKEKLIPRLRFSEFKDAGAWEQRKVKEIFKVTRGNVLATSFTSSKKTELMKYPVYSSQTTNEGLMGYYHSYLFDYAITWTTDGANAGTVKHRKGRFYSTNVNGVLLSTEGYVNKAVSEILNNVAWKHVSKVGNPKLMNNIMEEISILIPPSFAEQNKLSDFIDNIDYLITLHQRKLEKLKDTKSAFLSKMFPKEGQKKPSLRFSGFTDDWEQRKLGELTGKISDGDWIESNHIVEDGDFRIIQTGNIGVGEFLNKEKNSKFISFNSFNELKANEIYKDDILISRLADPAGRTIILPELKGRFVTAVDVAIIKPSGDFDSCFLMTYLNTELSLNELSKFVSGTSHKRISRKNLEKVIINVTNRNEQRLVGNLFSSIDNTITLHQRKLEKLKNIKNAYLNDMFV